MYSRIWPLGVLLLALCFAACQMPAALSPEPSQSTVITYEYTNPMTTSEGHMLIETDGHIVVVERVGTSDPVVHTADTYLTKDQATNILKTFKGWKQFKPYYPASFGPVFAISFDGYKVEAADSESAAPELLRVKHALDSLAGAAMKSMPHPTLPPAPPATAPAVTYILNTDIEYQFETDLGGPTLRRRITISRDDGLLKLQERTTGEGAHDPPVDVKLHLGSSQLETLANTLRQMPEGDQRYPGIEKGPYFSIKYDGRTIISGGLPDTPTSVKSAQLLIEGYSQDAKRFPEDD